MQIILVHEGDTKNFTKLAVQVEDEDAAPGTEPRGQIYVPQDVDLDDVEIVIAGHEDEEPAPKRKTKKSSPAAKAAAKKRNGKK